ncbi:MAG: hypothetical protein HZC47_08850 [Methanobacterium sp.]|uniref:hypothetical protein n=1 Tax=Methanobacterium sp. TaxID=2164 RepID=UPI003D648A8B|nr:hypothetical protein [Methanobacterium sp.]
MHKLFASIIGIIVFILTLSLIGISFGYILGHDASIGNFPLRIIAITIALIISSVVYYKIVDDEVKSDANKVQNKPKKVKSKEISQKLKEMRQKGE